MQRTRSRLVLSGEKTQLAMLPRDTAAHARVTVPVILVSVTLIRLALSPVIRNKFV